MGRAAIEDPLKNFRYRISIASLGGEIGFSECSKLSKEVEEIAYREGGDAETARKSPGLSKYTDITLKKGMLAGSATSITALWDWIEKVSKWDRVGSDEDFRTEVTISLYSNSGVLARSYVLENAWAKKWDGPDLKGDANENCIEELTVCYEGFRKTK